MLYSNGSFSKRTLSLLIPALALLTFALFVAWKPAYFNYYSAKDRDLMIRVAIWESRHEPRLGQMGVAYVIKNRWKKNPYGWRTISDVVTARAQFEPWLRHKEKLLAMSKDSKEYRHMASVVDDVLSGLADDPTNGAFYFLNVKIVKKRNKGRLPSGWKRIVAQPECRKIARHTFCPQ